MFCINELPVEKKNVVTEWYDTNIIWYKWAIPFFFPDTVEIFI